MATNQPVQYKYTSTKEYHDAFPCAYRQWRADSHCNLIHGYSFSMKFYFGTDNLDVRNWAADYGGLKELKKTLEDQFDHTLLVSADDPELATYKLLQEKKMAKLTILPRLGCEGLADMLYKYVNGVYIPDLWGPGEAERLWCYRVEVRETQSSSRIHIPTSGCVDRLDCANVRQTNWSCGDCIGIHPCYHCVNGSGQTGRCS